MWVPHTRVPGADPPAAEHRPVKEHVTTVLLERSGSRDHPLGWAVDRSQPLAGKPQSDTSCKLPLHSLTSALPLGSYLRRCIVHGRKQAGCSKIGLCPQGFQPGRPGSHQTLWPPYSQLGPTGLALMLPSCHEKLSCFKDPSAPVEGSHLGTAETTALQETVCKPWQAQAPVLPTSRSGRHSKVKDCFSPGKAPHRTWPRKHTLEKGYPM